LFLSVLARRRDRNDKSASRC